jgi:polysaccharide chain length determinant protein (PEP-CTERM system associated)
MGELPQQTDANLSAMERISTQLRLNSDAQIRVQERKESLGRQLSDVAALMPGAVGPEGTADRLARLNAELRALRTTYSDKYPDIARIKQEIATLEAEAAEGEKNPKDRKSTSTMSPAAIRIKQAQADLDSELSILKGEEKRLRATLSNYIGRVENSPKREQEFRELSRDYESTRENYNSLMKRYEEAQLAENLEQRQKGEQFRLLDPAVPGSEPTAPNRMRLLFTALAGCLALAVGVVVLAEQINASFHSVDELRAMASVPVLLTIPLIVTPDDTLRGQRRFRLAAASVAVALVVLVGASFFIAHGNDQLVAFVTKGRP